MNELTVLCMENGCFKVLDTVVNFWIYIHGTKSDPCLTSKVLINVGSRNDQCLVTDFPLNERPCDQYLDQDWYRTDDGVIRTKAPVDGNCGADAAAWLKDSSLPCTTSTTTTSTTTTTKTQTGSTNTDENNLTLIVCLAVILPVAVLAVITVLIARVLWKKPVQPTNGQAEGNANIQKPYTTTTSTTTTTTPTTTTTTTTTTASTTTTTFPAGCTNHLHFHTNPLHFPTRL
ncbi:integumentary mucin C.1-like isoform X3 [Dreissena polymorpha]|uniref:integumentary mucin C.1-like isoform X3 n=1 Tax=Dreissena polymorpha TaxID=45954 RepID=UPI0022648AEB|nr:integumentary mucin C.1-like isoform X3 [Dreissena polymorpha]